MVDWRVDNLTHFLKEASTYFEVYFTTCILRYIDTLQSLP
jgi:hypothetical protein